MGHKRATVGAVLALVPALLTAMPAGAASAATVTYAYTGAEQVFTVPSGVGQLQVVAIGAPGASGSRSGGFGARVVGYLPVVAGQTLFVEVGGKGNRRSESPAGAGGFNGGASGGQGGGTGRVAGGGGASDVRTVSAAQGGSLESRLLIAGGGGGAGEFYGLNTGGNADSPGGNGGNSQDAPSGGGGGGGAGTVSAPGAGGGGVGGAAGSPGTPGTGGTGGNSTGFGGGGGGGGRYGGGGGGGGDPNGSGGGGGGSSFTVAAAQSVTIGADSTGVPSVAITFSEPLPPLGPVTSVDLNAPIPSLFGLGFSKRTFAAEASGPSARNARKRKPPRGTRVTFRLDRASFVSFRVTRRARGRKVRKGGKVVCAKPTRKNRRRKRCTRVVTLPGGFERNGVPGTNSFHFTGRLGGRRLRPGRYRLVATPTSSGRIGTPTSSRFRIVR